MSASFLVSFLPRPAEDAALAAPAEPLSLPGFLPPEAALLRLRVARIAGCVPASLAAGCAVCACCAVEGGGGTAVWHCSEASRIWLVSMVPAGCCVD
jgi:hypothetical protein